MSKVKMYKIRKKKNTPKEQAERMRKYFEYKNDVFTENAIRDMLKNAMILGKGIAKVRYDGKPYRVDMKGKRGKR